MIKLIQLLIEIQINNQNKRYLEVYKRETPPTFKAIKFGDDEVWVEVYHTYTKTVGNYADENKQKIREKIIQTELNKKHIPFRFDERKSQFTISNEYIKKSINVHS